MLGHDINSSKDQLEITLLLPDDDNDDLKPRIRGE